MTVIPAAGWAYIIPSTIELPMFKPLYISYFKESSIGAGMLCSKVGFFNTLSRAREVGSPWKTTSTDMDKIYLETLALGLNIKHNHDKLANNQFNGKT